MVCKLRPAQAGALLLFVALVTPFATLAHFAAEAASLGPAAPGVLFAPHHAYLAVLNAVAALALANALGGRLPPLERRRRIALLVSALPGRGRGSPFFAAALVTQLLFFAITQLAEGDPIAAGHVAGGVAAAILTGAVGALIVARCKLRILGALVGLVRHAPIPRNVTLAAAWRPLPSALVPQRLLTLPGVASRPPPLPAA